MLSSSPLWMAGIGDIQQPPSSCFTGALAAKKQTQARKLTDGGGAGSLDAAGKGRGGGERRRRSSARGEGDTAQHVGPMQSCASRRLVFEVRKLVRDSSSLRSTPTFPSNTWAVSSSDYGFLDSL